MAASNLAGAWITFTNDEKCDLTTTKLGTRKTGENQKDVVQAKKTALGQPDHQLALAAQGPDFLLTAARYLTERGVRLLNSEKIY